MIELMGGHLEVESIVGVGSKFGFTLPFGMSDIPHPAADVAERIELPDNLHKPTFDGEVLVCEDNVINQDVICDHLDKVGLRSVVAPNGQVAVEQVRKRLMAGKPFDLILMDIHMPIMDGLEATRAIIRLGDKTPIVALTANAMEKDRDLYLAGGMSDYLAKPFLAPELWACLLKFLEPHSLSRVDKAEMVDFMDVSRVPGAATGGKSVKTGENADGSGTNMGVIDRLLGLRRSSGDLALYERVRQKFAQRNREVYREIIEHLQNGDVKAAHQIAHTLKGTAGLLGATVLSEAAFQVELALADGQASVTPEQLRALETALEAVFKELALDDTETASGASGSGGTALKSETPWNCGKALELLDRLEPLVQAGNAQSGGMLDEIERRLSPLGDDATILARQIDDYDFDEAVKTLQRLRQRLDEHGP